MTGRKTLLPSGKTFKISALRPTGILQWEKGELIPLYLNDVGNHLGEGGGLSINLPWIVGELSEKGWLFSKKFIFPA